MWVFASILRVRLREGAPLDCAVPLAGSPPAPWAEAQQVAPWFEGSPTENEAHTWEVAPNLGICCDFESSIARGGSLGMRCAIGREPPVTVDRGAAGCLVV